MRPVRTTARAMLGAIFIVSGARAVAQPDQLAGRAKRVTDRIAPMIERVDPRLPTEARTLVQLNGAAQMAAGALLVTHRFRRPAALVLAGTLIPTTVAGHPFWAYDDPAERRNQMTHFFKNLGLLGGLVLAAADTEGRPGLRWRTGHAVESAQRSLHRRARTARREVRLARRAAGVGRRLPG